jgi:hypothetical protein
MLMLREVARRRLIVVDVVVVDADADADADAVVGVVDDDVVDDICGDDIGTRVPTKLGLSATKKEKCPNPSGSAAMLYWRRRMKHASITNQDSGG